MKKISMKVSFSKNIQFSKLLKVRGRLKEFNFRKANASSTGLFTVDVLGDEGPFGNRIIFYMEKKEDRWRILPPEVPKWIMEKEDEMDELIRTELNG
jgi:hypothetical protein